MNCQCRIKPSVSWLRDEKLPLFEIEHCQLHRAAAQLLRGCQAAIAYLADPPDKFKENRQVATEIIMKAISEATRQL